MMRAALVCPERHLRHEGVTMLHWRTVGTTLAITALVAFAAIGGGFHWGAMSSFLAS